MVFVHNNDSEVTFFLKFNGTQLIFLSFTTKQCSQIVKGKHLMDSFLTELLNSQSALLFWLFLHFPVQRIGLFLKLLSFVWDVELCSLLVFISRLQYLLWEKKANNKTHTLTPVENNNNISDCIKFFIAL